MTALLVGGVLHAKVTEPKVGVAENVLTCSSTPKFTFKVQAGFSYLGHVQEYNEVANQNVETDPNRTNHVQRDAYLFVDATKDGPPRIFCVNIIQLAQRGWAFWNNLHTFLPENRYFERGRYRFANNNLWAATYVGNGFTQKQLSFLVDHDIKAPRLFTIRQVDGTVTVGASVKVSMVYAQDIRELSDGIPTTDFLTGSRRTRLADFIDLADAFFGKPADKESAWSTVLKDPGEAMPLSPDPSPGDHAASGTEQADEFKKTLQQAEQGDLESQFQVGLLYGLGCGVAADSALAASWYRKAAEGGHAMAAYELGMAYDQGDGLPQDPVEAYVWYSVAAERGNPTAPHCRDEQAQLFSPEVLAKADARRADLVKRMPAPQAVP